MKKFKRTYSIPEIAKKHGVPEKQISDQLKKGLEVEKEHSEDLEIRKKIALHHLQELGDYYDRLEKVEEIQSFSEWTGNKEIKGKSKLASVEGKYKIGQIVYLPGTNAPLKIIRFESGGIIMVQRPGGIEIEVDEGDLTK